MYDDDSGVVGAIEKSVLYAYRVLLPLCVAILPVVSAASAVLLLPGAVRHRVPDGKICCWFIESDPSVFFSFKRDLLLMYPWEYCRFSGLDLLHPR